MVELGPSIIPRFTELLQAAAGEVSIHSAIGRWRLGISQAIDSLAIQPVINLSNLVTQAAFQLLESRVTALESRTCCIIGVVIADGQVSQFVPFPPGCEQVDTNYVVTGVFRGGTLIGGQQFAISFKAPQGFQVSFANVTAGGILMDFQVQRCA